MQMPAPLVAQRPDAPLDASANVMPVGSGARCNVTEDQAHTPGESRHGRGPGVCGPPETAFDLARRSDERGHVVLQTAPIFWRIKAAQVKLGDRGFLSRDITVLDLLINRSDVHHVYPRNHLKKQGLARGRYNQIANFVLAQSEINIAIGDRAPEVYFKELAEQCAGGKKKYGGITDVAEMRVNLRMSCLPESLLDGPELRRFSGGAPQTHGAEDQVLV